ncbi:MAG TPA: DUF2167 domain-containing protein, partial [Candidatus Eisenbacteria bacterium]|nr:DUF2167 domain-containing protein [Candidatus Eisenbacteria bacterium]
MKIGRTAFRFFLALVCLSLSANGSCADDTKKEPERPKIDWIDGPVPARLGDLAEIKVPAGYRFTGKEGTKKSLELTGNPPSGDELGTIIPAAKSDDDKEFWFVI